MAFTKLYDVVMSMFVKGRYGERTQPRGVLVCYVHESGDLVRHGLGVGVVDFHTVFVQRPDSCRFAVLKMWDGRFLVVDLYDVSHVSDPDMRAPVIEFFAGNRWEFSTEEAALACAQMQL